MSALTSCSKQMWQTSLVIVLPSGCSFIRNIIDHLTVITKLQFSYNYLGWDFRKIFMNPIYVKHNNKVIQGTIFKTNKKKYLSTERKYSECDYQVWVKGSVLPCSDRTEKPVKIGEWLKTRTGISIHSIILLVNRVVTNNAQQWTYVLVF